MTPSICSYKLILPPPNAQHLFQPLSTYLSFHLYQYVLLLECFSTFPLTFLSVESTRLLLCLFSIGKKFLSVFVLLNVSFLEIGTTVHFKQKGMVLISNYLLHVKIKILQQCVRVLYTRVYFISTVCGNNFHNTFATIYSKIATFSFTKSPCYPCLLCCFSYSLLNVWN